MTNATKMAFNDKAFVTPLGILSYPSLFEKKMYKNKPETAQYSCELIFERDTDLSAAKKCVNNAIMEMWGTKRPSGLVLPFVDGNTLTHKRPDLENKIVIRAKNKKTKPVILDRNRAQIIEASAVYAGCIARMKVVANACDFGGTPRVIFYLLSLQKWADGTPLGNRGNIEKDYEVEAEGGDAYGDSENPGNYEQDETGDDTSSLGF